MTKDDLHKWRLFVPGIMCLVASISFVYPTIAKDDLVSLATLKELGVVTGAVVVFGTLYVALDVRRWFMPNQWQIVRENIDKRLLTCFERQRTRKTTEEEQSFLRSRRRLLEIFYKVADADETLKAKMSGVYFNGLLVSSLVDASVVACVAAAVHLAIGSVRSDSAHMTWFACLAGASLLCYVLARRLVDKTHLGLSNEQLDVIDDHHAKKICELCEQVLQNMPVPSKPAN